MAKSKRASPFFIRTFIPIWVNLSLISVTPALLNQRIKKNANFGWLPRSIERVVHFKTPGAETPLPILTNYHNVILYKRKAHI